MVYAWFITQTSYDNVMSIFFFGRPATTDFTRKCTLVCREIYPNLVLFIATVVIQSLFPVKVLVGQTVNPPYKKMLPDIIL